MATLSVLDSGLSLPLQDDVNLLKQCLEAGLDVARSCRNGNCGRCDSVMLKGQVQLRSADIQTAPATIALCISRALGDIELRSLPLLATPSQWHCQWLNQQILLLPAGRQYPPRQGDWLALLFDTHVEINNVSAVNGRQIILTTASPSPPKNSIGVLTIDREHAGHYQLQRKDQSHILWQNVDQHSAQAALAYYRHRQPSGQFTLVKSAL
jgi:hypothetical protein